MCFVNVWLNATINIERYEKMSDIIIFLCKVEFECKVKSIIHSETANYYNKINLFCNYPALGILSLCGSAFLAGSGFFNLFSYMLQILAVLNIIACFAVNIANFVNFTKAAEDHMQLSKDYSRLYREILYFRRLYTNVPDRNFLILFCSNIIQRLNMIHATEIDYPEKIMRSIYSTSDEKLRDKYFIAQTKYRKYKYNTQFFITKFFPGAILCQPDF